MNDWASELVFYVLYVIYLNLVEFALQWLK